MDEENVDSKNSLSKEKLYRIIEVVRMETRLSHKLAAHAVHVVFMNFWKMRPFEVNDVLQLYDQGVEPLEMPPALLDQTEDMDQLRKLSDNLNYIKNDAQQRSWVLHDDQAPIVTCLNELNSILTDADIFVTKRFLQVTDYDIVSCLAEYYQMESRWTIKIIILKVCDILCILSRTAVAILLGSVLPLELTRDIQINHEDNEKLFACVRVIIKLFAIGEPIPVFYFDTINKDFILFLLNLIETSSYDPDQEENVIELIHFILVYNLQFKSRHEGSENITIEALEEAENPKIFSETLLLLFNRGKDPVEILNHEPYPPNSLLKMITDIFSSDTASNIFYKNDVKVLLDIVLRQLTDHSPNPKERMQWLELVKRILVKTDHTVYEDHLNEMESCISRISNDVEDSNCEANELIREILDLISLLVRVCKLYYGQKVFYYCPLYVTIGSLFRISMALRDMYQISMYDESCIPDNLWYYDGSMYSKNIYASLFSFLVIIGLNFSLILGVVLDKNFLLFPWTLTEIVELLLQIIILLYKRENVFSSLSVCVWKFNYWLMTCCLLVGRTCILKNA